MTGDLKKRALVGNGSHNKKIGGRDFFPDAQRCEEQSTGLHTDWHDSMHRRRTCRHPSLSANRGGGQNIWRHTGRCESRGAGRHAEWDATKCGGWDTSGQNGQCGAETVADTLKEVDSTLFYSTLGDVHGEAPGHNLVVTLADAEVVCVQTSPLPQKKSGEWTSMNRCR